MRLTEFIAQHHEEILIEWVAFAKTLMPWAKDSSETELRDHADELLTVIVRDMNSAQTNEQQEEKSKGNAKNSALALVGHRHAADRLASGLNMDQMLSEYRALRASVLRLWEANSTERESEVTRFNEAIDETLAESAMRYTEILSKTRDQFLGILGHDLRNPLGAVLMGATLLLDSEDEEQVKTARLIQTSGERMSRMINDLLDLTRSRLGAGIPIQTHPLDLEEVCRQIISELGSSHPEAVLRFDAKGDLRGEWDGDRVMQMISNLAANAIQHGGAAMPVTIKARGEDDGICLEVHNGGTPIAKAALKTLFEPMTRLASGASSSTNPTGLGLGLYIASQVACAHGGSIEVSSTAEKGTTFTVRLPRRSQAAPASRASSSDRPVRR